MMCSVRVVADGGCDLTPELAAQSGVTVVPVFVSFGSEMVDSDHITSKEFWERAARSPVPPGTAGPPAFIFQQAFGRLVADGHDVVCLTLPARHSGTYNAAWLAAQEFGPHVRVVDSGSISLGIGLLALYAAGEARAGRSAPAIQQALERLREHTSVIFVLETVEWARRGGRLERVMPLIDRFAQTLRAKPVLEIANGEFRLLGITRSSRGALQRIEDEVRARLPVQALAVAYTRGQDAAPELAARLAGVAGQRPEDVRLTEAGPVFAAHAGPGALGAVVIGAQ